MTENMSTPNPTLSVVIVGHVDHGKSTLIGRLLHDCGALPPEKIAALRRQSKARGLVATEWSFVTDALQSERDQGITIDAAQVRFRSARREYVLVDAPGHKEFLKNMVTGAATADAAILVVDASEGVSEQTRRHAYVLRLLGLRQLIVAVNKMDLVGYAETVFRAVASSATAYLASIGLTPAATVPLSARHGDGIAAASPHFPWHDGPSLLEALDAFKAVDAFSNAPLRLPVQDIYKFDERRIVVGRIETGRLRVGDKLIFEPGARSAAVQSIETWHVARPAVAVAAGQSVGIVLDDDIFVERGQVASHPECRPLLATLLEARLLWLGREPLSPGQTLGLRLGMADHPVTVREIRTVLDLGRLEPYAAQSVGRNEIAEVVLSSRNPVVCDDADGGGFLARGALLQDGDIVAGCIVEWAGEAEPGINARDNIASIVSALERQARYRHSGGVVWLTGLSGAGKSTLALALERALFQRSWHCIVLDGDDVRETVNSDLGFAMEDREENVRRIGEIAGLLAQSGQIAIIACISPARRARALARDAVGSDRFAEVFVKADVEACAARDPKGLYRRAHAGDLPAFTGVSAPYEAPETPALEIDTERLSLPEASQRLVAYVVDRFGFETTPAVRREAP
jgi:bifunctional enzyme CysN/CysC